jgi:hypothetical protein
MLLRINQRKREKTDDVAAIGCDAVGKCAGGSALPLVVNPLRQLPHRALRKEWPQTRRQKRTLHGPEQPMTKQFKGTSQLALVAEDLPVRSRIGLTLVAADLALNRLRSSHNFPIAQAAFELPRQWYDGDRFPPDLFEDALWNEHDRGLCLCEIAAKSEREKAAWCVVGSAILYTAFHAYQAIGGFPSAVVSEVEENELDELDRELRLISPALINVVIKAADVIRQHPDISFAQLKSSLAPSL